MLSRNALKKSYLQIDIAGLVLVVRTKPLLTDVLAATAQMKINPRRVRPISSNFWDYPAKSRILRYLLYGKNERHIHQCVMYVIILSTPSTQHFQ